MDDGEPASASDADRGEPPSVAGGLRARLGGLRRAEPDGAAAGMTAEELEAADVHVSPSQIDALVALGILGRRVTGGAPRVVWLWDGAGEAQAEAPGQLAAVDAGGTEVAEAGGDAHESEEFLIDVAADQQHERLLMYRVILSFATVAAVLVVREIATGLL
jgi:hypothetical protein